MHRISALTCVADSCSEGPAADAWCRECLPSKLSKANEMQALQNIHGGKCKESLSFIAASFSVQLLLTCNNQESVTKIKIPKHGRDVRLWLSKLGRRAWTDEGISKKRSLKREKKKNYSGLFGIAVLHRLYEPKLQWIGTPWSCWTTCATKILTIWCASHEHFIVSD